MTADVAAPTHDTTDEHVRWVFRHPGLVIKIVGWVTGLCIFAFGVGGHLRTIEANLETMNGNLAALTRVAEGASQAAAANRRDIDVMKERQAAILSKIDKLDPAVRALEVLAAELKTLVLTARGSQ